MSDPVPATGSSRREVQPLSLLVGFVVMILALGLGLIAAQPPAPKPLSASENEFSAARAIALVERLLGDGAPHPVGSDANARVADRIGDELTRLGYQVETQTAFGCSAIWTQCGYVSNLVSRLPGRSDGPAVLLTAHYDSVAAGPGAADDMAGVAAILEIARILRTEPRPLNPVIFLFSDGEEPGMLGAEAFASDHPLADQVGVVVNLEASGTRGQSVLFETTEENAWLIDTFAAVAPRPVAASLFDELFTLLPLNTDLTVYESAGLPGVNFAFSEEHTQYHTPLDNAANLDPGSVQHHGDNALAAVRAFAARDLTAPPAGRSVYQDVVPGLVLRWPESWTVWIAIACLAIWGAIAGTFIRRHDLSPRALLWGAIVFPVGVLAAGLLGLGLGLGVGALTGSPMPWYANPAPMRVAFWTAALLGVTLIATLVARRAGFLGVVLGVWLWWSALSALVALATPGASVPFLLPTVLATLAVAAVVWSPLRNVPHGFAMAAMIALFGACWFWLPFALAAEHVGAGADLGVIVGIAVGIAVTALTPFMALPGRYVRVQRWGLTAAALLIVVAVGVAARVPVYSAMRPQGLNVLHYEDRHAGQAFWVIEDALLTIDDASDLPPPLREAGSFTNPPAPVFPWSSDRYFAVPAASAGQAAPVVDILEDTHIANERVVRIRLQSPRGGHRLSLYIPEEAGLNRIELEETDNAFTEIDAADGYHAFHCFAPACDGLTMALHLQSDEAFTMFVEEAVPELPEGGAALMAARTDLAAPRHAGDRSLVVDRVTVDAP